MFYLSTFLCYSVAYIKEFLPTTVVSTANPKVAGSNLSCAAAFSMKAKMFKAHVFGFWVHVEEPQMVEISTALDYGVSHNHIVA